MLRIVAIGGGSIHRPSKRPERTAIDETIVKMSGKKKPRVLFVPTASDDSPEYITLFKKQYGDRLQCTVETLELYHDRPSKKEIEARIKRADIIYVGGGNTLRMMKLWRKLGVDTLLIRAAKKGTVCCGLSAGAVCWFRECNSDSRKSIDPSADYIRVKGLNLVNALLCPHYDSEPERQPSLKRMMKKVPGVAITLTDCAAIVIEGGEYRIITSKKKAWAQRVFWKREKYVKEELSSGTFSSILSRGVSAPDQ
jgi:dipeptidase E